MQLGKQNIKMCVCVCSPQTMCLDILKIWSLFHFQVGGSLWTQFESRSWTCMLAPYGMPMFSMCCGPWFRYVQSTSITMHYLFVVLYVVGKLALQTETDLLNILKWQLRCFQRFKVCCPNGRRKDPPGPRRRGRRGTPKVAAWRETQVAMMRQIPRWVLDLVPKRGPISRLYPGKCRDLIDQFEKYEHIRSNWWQSSRKGAKKHQQACVLARIDQTKSHDLTEIVKFQIFVGKSCFAVKCCYNNYLSCRWNSKFW